MLSMNGESVYSVRQAAMRLGITPSRVRQLVLAKRIRAIRFVRDLAVPESEIARYQRERRRYRRTAVGL